MNATESDIETLRIHTEASSSEHTFFLAVGIVPANFCSARWWASFQRAVLQLDFSPFLSVFFFLWRFCLLFCFPVLFFLRLLGTCTVCIALNGDAPPCARNSFQGFTWFFLLGVAPSDPVQVVQGCSLWEGKKEKTYCKRDKK